MYAIVLGALPQFSLSRRGEKDGRGEGGQRFVCRSMTGRTGPAGWLAGVFSSRLVGLELELERCDGDLSSGPPGRPAWDGMGMGMGMDPPGPGLEMSSRLETYTDTGAGWSLQS